MATSSSTTAAPASASTALSEIVREHQTTQLEHRRGTEQLRRDAIRDIGDLCDAATTSLSTQLTHVLDNQREIESLSHDCAQLVQQHARSTAKWTRLVDQFNGALKELGDVRNWAQVIERDMLDVAATLELVHSSLNPQNDAADPSVSASSPPVL